MIANLSQIFICIFAAAFTLYACIENQNALTELQMTIPALAKEVQSINEDNIRMQYEIDQFESPVHLIELLRQPEFGHLKYPNLDEIVTLPEGIPSPE